MRAQIEQMFIQCFWCAPLRTFAGGSGRPTLPEWTFEVGGTVGLCGPADLEGPRTRSLPHSHVWFSRLGPSLEAPMQAAEISSGYYHGDGRHCCLPLCLMSDLSRGRIFLYYYSDAFVGSFLYTHTHMHISLSHPPSPMLFLLKISPSLVILLFVLFCLTLFAFGPVRIVWGKHSTSAIFIESDLKSFRLSVIQRSEFPFLLYILPFFALLLLFSTNHSPTKCD